MLKPETITQRIRRAVTETGTSAQLAARLAKGKGWKGSPRQWQSRLGHMLSGGMPNRTFDVDYLPDAIEITGDVSLLSPAHAAVIRVQAEESSVEAPTRRQLVKVAPSSAPHRRRA